MTRPPLTFRIATDSDVDVLADLNYHSFPTVSMSFEARKLRFSEDPRVRVENYLVGEANGAIVTALHSIPFTTWIRGDAQPLQGVASVVVAPEARRRGYASELVVESMRRKRAEGLAVSALYPFRHTFYASIGYANAVEHREWCFRPEDLPHYPERSSVRRAVDADLGSIDSCYQRVARRSCLMVGRSTADWVRRHFDFGKRFAVVYDDGGGVGGYFIYEYEELEDGRLTRLAIREIVYEHERAFRGLLGHVAALKDQFLDASMITRPTERLDLRLANPRRRGSIKGSISKFYGPRTVYGAMVRLIDVARAIERSSGYSVASGGLRLAVADAQIPENRGPWEISFSDGACRVERGSDGPCDVEVGIGALSQIYVGFASAFEARRVGLLSGSDAAVELLDRAFSTTEPSLIDHF